MANLVKKLLKRSLAKGFEIGQRLGIDVLPRHFYSEIPHISQLRQSTDWRKPLSLIGISQADDLDCQLDFVRKLMTPAVIGHLASKDVYTEACQQNGATGYGKIEAQSLYAFVHTLQPRKIVQVGCGVSTALCEFAAKDAGYDPSIVCIDPYPTDFLLQASQAGRIELIQKPVQHLTLDFFEELEPGDLFFVDSTHTLGPAGEVTRIILEMLPRVNAGVYVHFHDIWFPYDYSPILLSQPLFFWHETALLAAYLSGNPKYQIQASFSQLHFSRQQALQKLYPAYQPAKMQDGIITQQGDFPSSIYLRCQ